MNVANNTASKTAWELLVQKANTANMEWSSRVMTDFSGNAFTTSAIHTTTDPIEGTSNSFTQPFSWEPSTGEISSGIIHTHPQGVGNIPCLSVDDIWVLKSFVDFYFDQYATDARKDFLNNNVSITAIDASNTYIATVNNWQGLKDYFDSHNQDDVDRIVINDYKNNYYSFEAALLKQFGGLINLYTSPTSAAGVSDAKKIEPSGEDSKQHTATDCN